MILNVTTKVRWLSKNSPRCTGQGKSPDFNSQRAVSQIAPPDAFPRGRHCNSNARARVKFQVLCFWTREATRRHRQSPARGRYPGAALTAELAGMMENNR